MLGMFQAPRMEAVRNQHELISHNTVTFNEDLHYATGSIFDTRNPTKKLLFRIPSVEFRFICHLSQDVSWDSSVPFAGFRDSSFKRCNTSFQFFISTNPLFNAVSVFLNITMCIPLKVNRRFGGTYHLHLQGRQCLPPAIMLVSITVYSILKMEAICSFETSLALQ
jgi:hypothetical protein